MKCNWEPLINSVNTLHKIYVYERIVSAPQNRCYTPAPIVDNMVLSTNYTYNN